MDPLSQVFCLRWNNHRNNLLTVFDHLLQTEAFCDVTLACDGASIKAHKMILSACSSYFQHLFMENTCEHPIVFLKDIKYEEIRAILDYMYKGEVNVAQEQLPGLLRVAELLKVKGLVEEEREKLLNSGLKEGRPIVTTTDDGDQQQQQQPPRTPKLINGEKEPPTTPSSSSSSNLPPPPGLSGLSGGVRPFMYTPPSGGPPFPWPLPGLLQGGLFNRGEKDENNDKEGSPSPKEPGSASTPSGAAKRKKTASGSGGSSSSKESGLGSLPPPPMLNLAPNAAAASAVDPDSHHLMNRSRDSQPDSDKMSGGGEPADKDVMMDKGGIANYVPNQRLEWKRYKQYTRNDIMCAIEEVKKGMSALQASRKYGVPSRTLYDKVKKMGITTGRQMQKKSLPQYPASFPSMPGVRNEHYVC